MFDRRRFLTGTAASLTVAVADGLPFRALSGLDFVSLSDYEAEAEALFERMASPPNRSRRNLINSTILSLKRADIWDRLEGFYMLAAHTQQASLLNWRRSSANLVAVNSPRFLADRGFSGDGVTSYLTNFNSEIARMQPTDLTLTARLGKASGDNDRPGVAISNWNTYFDAANGSSGFGWSAASSAEKKITLKPSQLLTITRESRGRAYAYVDGSLVETDKARDLSRSPFRASDPLTIFRRGETYQLGSVSFAAYGSALDAGMVAQLHDSVQTYITAVSE